MSVCDSVYNGSVKFQLNQLSLEVCIMLFLCIILLLVLVTIYISISTTSNKSGAFWTKMDLFILIKDGFIDKLMRNLKHQNKLFMFLSGGGGGGGGMAGKFEDGVPAYHKIKHKNYVEWASYSKVPPPTSTPACRPTCAFQCPFNWL